MHSSLEPLFFAFLVTIPFAVWHSYLIRDLASKLRWTLWGLFSLKMILALTMGHFDMYRFIVFIQKYISNLSENPWLYSLKNQNADFPYPPFLLYLHTLVMFPFRELLNQSEPFAPTAYGYTLIRIPFLLADFTLLTILLKRFRKSQDWKSFTLYLFSPVILFHQYYSGQMDLIAVVPFFLGTLLLEEEGWTLKVFLLYSISLILKPFAVLFFPFLLIVTWQNSKKWIQLLIGLVSCLLVFKLSELPYGLNPVYRTFMGAGATFFLGNHPLASVPLFPMMAFFLGVYLFHLRSQELKQVPAAGPMRVSETIVGVTLCVSTFSYHSAGWMTWMVPFIVVLSESKRLVCSSALWKTWGLLFILRWATVSHSPLLDSFGVFTHLFLKCETSFEMGAFYKWVSATFGIGTAEAMVTSSLALFCIVSFLLLIEVLGALSKPQVGNS